MNSNLLKDLLQEHNPELFETMQTEQYELSNQIVKLRVQSSLTLEDLAAKLGLTPEEYLDYEYGETKYSVEEYKHLINKIEQIKSRSEIGIVSNAIRITGSVSSHREERETVNIQIAKQHGIVRTRKRKKGYRPSKINNFGGGVWKKQKDSNTIELLSLH